MIRAFSVTLTTSCTDFHMIIFADSSSKAKYVAYLGAKEAGYKPHFRYIRSQRAKEYDKHIPYIGHNRSWNPQYLPYK